MSALIISGNRGLGLGLVREFVSKGYKVTATTRDVAKSTDLTSIGGVKVLPLDITELDKSAEFFDGVKGQVYDHIFIVSGIMGQNYATATPADTAKVFYTNSVAPLALAGKLILNLGGDKKGVLTFMSSIMGSCEIAITGPDQSSYGASKAALNHAVATFAKYEKHNAGAIVLMHPGWVQTDMGGANAPLTVDVSCKGMVSTLERVEKGEFGPFAYIDYEGKKIPF